MKIEVRFTLEVPKDQLAALRELACVDNNTDAAYFVRAEAEDTVVEYLRDNYVNSKVIRRDGNPVSRSENSE